MPRDRRFGLAAIEERGTTCCYARQDKFWVQATPDGERWEVYTVLEDSATFSGGQAECCGTEPDGQAVCCG